ncbi:MAG: hypothetical protein ACPGEF_04620, partial [Endozoicomonas sp.]
MKILEFDSGNTRLKWRLLEDGRVHTRGFILNNNDWGIALGHVMGQITPIDCVMASIVSGSERLALLREATSKYLDVPFY